MREDWRRGTALTLFGPCVRCVRQAVAPELARSPARPHALDPTAGLAEDADSQRQACRGAALPCRRAGVAAGGGRRHCAHGRPLLHGPPALVLHSLPALPRHGCALGLQPGPHRGGRGGVPPHGAARRGVHGSLVCSGWGRGAGAGVEAFGRMPRQTNCLSSPQHTTT